MWLGVDPRTGTEKDMCLRDIGLHAQIMLTILNSMVIMIMGDLIWPLNDHRNLHFDN